MVQKNAHKCKGKNKGVSQTTNFKKKSKTDKNEYLRILQFIRREFPNLL
jgi:hypothetical protein